MADDDLSEELLALRRSVVAFASLGKAAESEVDGADGDALFESTFGDSDRDRLEALIGRWGN